MQRKTTNFLDKQSSHIRMDVCTKAMSLTRITLVQDRMAMENGILPTKRSSSKDGGRFKENTISPSKTERSLMKMVKRLQKRTWNLTQILTTTPAEMMMMTQILTTTPAEMPE